jgi:glutamate-1-semialdehyde 2,1-aminomutase
MHATLGHHTSIASSYAAMFRRSESISEQARKRIPSGVVHDGRYRDPFPVYIEAANGSRKRTVEGVELVDYVMGHGSLLFGHNPEYAVEVLDRCNRTGAHMSGCHPFEVEWAEHVCRLIPSAERVRFTLTGTEATQLAFRIARAATGRKKILRLTGHYHGWHDYGLMTPDRAESAGIPPEIADTLAFADPELAAIERVLSEEPVAAVVLEPSGAMSGAVPLDREFLVQVRELTNRTGSLLVFDEVITGFRWAPGGAQSWFDVVPDVTTLGKILAGGMPGAAVAGRRDVIQVMEYTSDPDRNDYSRVAHFGTWNAFHHSAALGAATLERLADGEAQDAAANLAARLRAELQSHLEKSGLSGCVYGERSCIRFVMDLPGALPDLPPSDFLRTVPAERLLQSTPAPLKQLFWTACLVEGIDWMAGTHGWVSAVHTEADIEFTADAFERALQRVVTELESTTAKKEN